jgi:two-component sensor histidine kinase
VPVEQRPDDTSQRRLADQSPSELLLAEFIHRSANDFAVACAEIHVASRMPTLAEMRSRLELVVTRMHALASIQRMLQPSKTSVIDLGNALCELCQLSAEARFAEQGAFIQMRTCEGFVDAERGLALLMIVSEILTNAARHAFSGPGGLVQIDVSKADEMLVCRIGDNGVGMDGAPEEGRVGTKIITELARSAGIALAIPSADFGTRFELRVPRAND